MSKIVIFDMDGTLINSSKDMTSTINYVRKTNYNLEPLDSEFVTTNINMKNENLAKIFYGVDEYSQKDHDLFHKHYIDECILNSHLYDGISELLETLLSHNLKLSLATNASTIFASRMSKHLKISHYFDYIVGADRVQNSKPHPDMLNLILDSYGYNRDIQSAFMVGDSLKDIEAATSANITPVFASWGFTSLKDVEHTIKSPKDLLKIVI